MTDDYGAFLNGSHTRLWDLLGAHPTADGVRFRVWAPRARGVQVAGDWNGWTTRAEMHRVTDPASGRDTGVWEAVVDDALPGHHYKFAVEDYNGWITLRADPMATATEVPPSNASVVCGRSGYEWGDGEWMTARPGALDPHRPLRIYEVHLGSWRSDLQNYRDIAVALAGHVSYLGFTHVELLPVSEYPYGPSWGYQVTGYYAPTARHGTTDDFRAFVDTMHAHGIGVLVDWVPAHFPRDSWALARFDGGPLYEHYDPRRGEQPDWGTLVFDFGRPEIRSFLTGSALHWLAEYHVDGLRVDAVASMLYLDYSRSDGGWVPNSFGGREHLEAIDFFRHLNGTVQWKYPGTLMVAEESTSFPAVTHPATDGGLGFTHKWNMGWMNDTLRYVREDPLNRRWHHNLLTFGLMYTYSERFVLPLSHDEVVHGKGSMYGKVPGDRWQKLATLRTLFAWMWSLPGAPLLFMGAELAMPLEWDENRGLPWHLDEDAGHRGVGTLIAALSTAADRWPALYEADNEPGGFQWLDPDDAAHSLYAFLRLSTDASQAVACIANFTPVPRPGYTVGLPWGGDWEVIVDTDDVAFAGSGYRAGSNVTAEEAPSQHQPFTARVDLPPLAMLWLAAARRD